MSALAGNLVSVGSPMGYPLFFARQPEPDLEFTEEELEQTATTRPTSSMKPPKKSGGKPFLWILLLALIGGAAYLAMEPEQLSEWLAPLLGESTTQQTPPTAMRPKSQPEPAPAPPPAPPATPSGDSASAPPAGSASNGDQQPAAPPLAKAPAPAAPAPPSPAQAPAAPTQASSPLFAEGQKVTVMGNPAAPTEMVQLTLDPAGSKPGPTIRPGATLSILDGDLQPGGWVYSVRTEDGLKGWVAERRLRMKF
ncbi:MAG TPA: SH3 domain-containing protein [Nitrospira sp.]|nr:SH3 domain-containing protein [Nitrospira sp.]